MEYVDEEILKIGCNEKKHNERTSFIKRHKALTIITILTAVLIGINAIMIREFFYLISTL